MTEQTFSRLLQEIDDIAKRIIADNRKKFATRIPKTDKNDDWMNDIWDEQELLTCIIKLYSKFGGSVQLHGSSKTQYIMSCR